MPLVKRSVKGSALTMAEFDGNYDWFTAQDLLKANVDDPRFTDARPMSDGDKGPFTVTGGVAAMDQNSIGNTHLADMAVNTIKGRATAGTGDPEDLTATQVRTIADMLGFSPTAVVTTNFNGIIKSGLYTNAGTAATGAPNASLHWQLLDIHGNSGTTAIQIAGTAGSDQLWFRRQAAAVYTAWKVIPLLGQNAVAFEAGDKLLLDRGGVQVEALFTEILVANLMTSVTADQVVAKNSANTGFTGISFSPDVPATGDTIINRSTDVLESVYSNAYHSLLYPHAGSVTAGVLTIDLVTAPFANWTVSTGVDVQIKIKALPTNSTARGFPITVTLTNTGATARAVTIGDDTAKITRGNEVPTTINIPAQIGASAKLWFDPRSLTHFVLSSAITSPAPPA